MAEMKLGGTSTLGSHRRCTGKFSFEAAHPLVAAHSEALAGDRLPVAYPLHQAVPDDGVLMLACTAPQNSQGS